MSPVTTPDRSTEPRILRRPGRMLGAVCLAGVLAVSGACASSSNSTAGVIEFRTLDAGGPQTVGALEAGSIDIAELFTFTPAIAKNGWVTLEDDKNLQAADHFVPLIRTEKNTDDIGAVVDAVTAKLTHDNIMAMVKEVSVEGKNPEDVAENFLKDNDLPGSLKASGSITVGSGNFSESEVVGRLYAEALDEAGMDVSFKDAVGNRQVTMPMMEKGDLDLMPEFTYSLLAYLDSNAEASNDLDKVTDELTKALPDSLKIRKPSDVSDVNVFVVTPETAKKYDLKTISDLANVKDDLTLGGPPECPKNAACIPGLEKVYGLHFDVK